jgi:spermidine/putrescine-binding protein
MAPRLARGGDLLPDRRQPDGEVKDMDAVWKRWHAALAAVMVPVLIVAACSPGGGSATNGKIGGTLRIETFGGDQEKKFLSDIMQPWADQHGVQVVAGTFGVGLELLTSVKAAPGQYDLLMGFSEAETYLGAKQGALEPIRMANVPNWKNIADQFAKPLGDLDTAYGVTYWVDTYTYVYNKDHITNPGNYDPMWDPKNTGKIAPRDQPQGRIFATARYLGFDPNNLTDAQTDQVFAKMAEQCSLTRTYWKSISDIQTLLVNDEVWLSDVWGLDNIGAGNLSKLGWYYPKEGGLYWQGQLNVAKGSTNRDTAEAFLNYLLDPQVYAKAASIFGAPTAKADLWDPNQIFAEKPIEQAKAVWIRDHGVLPDPQKYLTVKDAWFQRYNEMKLKCGQSSS